MIERPDVALHRKSGVCTKSRLGRLGLNSGRGSVCGLKLLFDRVESHVVSGDAVAKPVDLGDFVGEAIKALVLDVEALAHVFVLSIEALVDVFVLSVEALIHVGLEIVKALVLSVEALVHVGLETVKALVLGVKTLVHVGPDVVQAVVDGAVGREDSRKDCCEGNECGAVVFQPSPHGVWPLEEVGLRDCITGRGYCDLVGAWQQGERIWRHPVDTCHKWL